MDRITVYFRPDGTLGHDHMPSQHWHKRGYSHEGGPSNGSRNWHHSLPDMPLVMKISKGSPWDLIVDDSWSMALSTCNTHYYILFLSKQDGCVYETIGELLHSSRPMPWERATQPGQTLPGSMKLFSSESHHADLCTMPWPSLGN